MNDPQNSADIGQLYDKSAKAYERAVWLPNLLFINQLRQQLFAKASGRVLEIGVGSGINLPFFPTGCEIVGIDLSAAMLQLAALRAKTLKLNAQFHMMDAEHLDFSAGSFDTVVSSLSLCIFPEPINVLREIARVCRPNGRIIMLEHGRSTNAGIAHFQDQRADMFVDAVGCHWNRDVPALIQEAGLTLVKDRQMLLGIIHNLEMTPGQPNPAWQAMDAAGTSHETVVSDAAGATFDKQSS